MGLNIVVYTLDRATGKLAEYEGWDWGRYIGDSEVPKFLDVTVEIDGNVYYQTTNPKGLKEGMREFTAEYDLDWRWDQLSDLCTGDYFIHLSV